MLNQLSLDVQRLVETTTLRTQAPTSVELYHLVALPTILNKNSVLSVLVYAFLTATTM